MPESQRQLPTTMHASCKSTLLFWLIHIQLTHGAAGGFVAQPVGATAHKKLFSNLSIV